VFISFGAPLRDDMRLFFKDHYLNNLESCNRHPSVSCGLLTPDAEFLISSVGQGMKQTYHLFQVQ